MIEGIFLMAEMVFLIIIIKSVIADGAGKDSSKRGIFAYRESDAAVDLVQRVKK